MRAVSSRAESGRKLIPTARCLLMASQCGEQFVVDAAEAAVGHDGDDVARAQFGSKAAHDLVRAFDGESWSPLCRHLRGQFARVEQRAAT